MDDKFLKYAFDRMFDPMWKYKGFILFAFIQFLLAPILFNPKIGLKNVFDLEISIFGMTIPYACIPLGLFFAFLVPYATFKLLYATRVGKLIEMSEEVDQKIDRVSKKFADIRAEFEALKALHK